jgi:hypothetical protein
MFLVPHTYSALCNSSQYLPPNASGLAHCGEVSFRLSHTPGGAAAAGSWSASVAGDSAEIDGTPMGAVSQDSRELCGAKVPR